jgi:hypothetical protein
MVDDLKRSDRLLRRETRKGTTHLYTRVVVPFGFESSDLNSNPGMGSRAFFVSCSNQAI